MKVVIINISLNVYYDDDDLIDQDLYGLTYDSQFIIQRYISQPHLIGGYKVVSVSDDG